MSEEDYRDPRLPPNQGLGEGSVNGRLSQLASRTLEFNLSQSLQWSKLLDDKHNVDILGVTEYRRGFEDDFNTPWQNKLASQTSCSGRSRAPRSQRSRTRRRRSSGS